jgi:hypothetical protein
MPSSEKKESASIGHPRGTRLPRIVAQKVLEALTAAASGLYAVAIGNGCVEQPQNVNGLLSLLALGR